MFDEITKNREDILLLNLFNNRDEEAFSKVYRSIYDELYYFANRIYHGETISTEDVVQDLFISVWENKKLSFSTFSGIKSYMYIGIKNRFLKYLSHKKCVDKHQEQMILEDRFITIVSESEIVSLLSNSIELLPEECAKVFKLCVEGWEIKEIAQKLGKSESTVYKQREKSIRILSKKLSKEDLFLLITLVINS